MEGARLAGKAAQKLSFGSKIYICYCFATFINSASSKVSWRNGSALVFGSR